jgi:hypothetical protein
MRGGLAGLVDPAMLGILGLGTFGADGPFGIATFGMLGGLVPVNPAIASPQLFEK